MAIQNVQNQTPADAGDRLSAEQRQGILASTNVIDPKSLSEIIELAKVMHGSGLWPDLKNAQAAAAIMILGKQFGLDPGQSLTGIHLVKGKPMLHYAVLLARVRQHPDYDYRIVEHTDKVCKIEFKYKGEPCGISEFTDADAKKQGTQNLDKFPKTMLLARAASNGIKWYAPDVLNGMPVYVQGELPADESVPFNASIRDRLNADLTAKQAAESLETEAVEIDEEYGDVHEYTGGLDV